MEVRYLSNIVIVLASLFSTIGFFNYPELWLSTACITPHFPSKFGITRTYLGNIRYIQATSRLER